MGEEKTPAKREEMDGGRKLLAAAVILLAAAIVLLAFLLLKSSRTGRSGIVRDTTALAGQLEGKTQEEILAELNRIVDEGMFNIAINTTPIFRDGESEGPLEIENVPGNLYLMQVQITLDETGELVYETGLIEPNHHIQNAKLDIPLAAGNYPATAVFNAYDPETEDYVGSAGAKMSITVLN